MALAAMTPVSEKSAKTTRFDVVVSMGESHLTTAITVLRTNGERASKIAESICVCFMNNCAAPAGATLQV